MDHRSRAAVSVLSGAAMAVAAAQLFVMGGPTALAADTNHAKIHCAGANACKGKSECSSASNGCKGQNECKGQGWMSMTEKKCLEKGGKPDKS